ncbi:hypothetical protein ABEP00_17520, partial [Heyndrickxia sporothermodurans]
KRFDAVDQKFIEVDKRFDAVDQKFIEVDKRFDAVDQKFIEVDKRFDAVDQKFVEVDKRFDAVDQKFVEVDKRLDAVDSRLENLETGQIELKDMLKHSTTLLIENFTSIRQDIRQRDTEMNADINLLFRKTEKNERDIEKIKSKLKI